MTETKRQFCKKVLHTLADGSLLTASCACSSLGEPDAIFVRDVLCFTDTFGSLRPFLDFLRSKTFCCWQILMQLERLPRSKSLIQWWQLHNNVTNRFWFSKVEIILSKSETESAQNTALTNCSPILRFQMTRFWFSHVGQPINLVVFKLIVGFRWLMASGAFKDSSLGLQKA